MPTTLDDLAARCRRAAETLERAADNGNNVKTYEMVYAIDDAVFLLTEIAQSGARPEPVGVETCAISEAEIESGAKALFDSRFRDGYSAEWATASDAYRLHYLDEARACLTEAYAARTGGRP